MASWPPCKIKNLRRSFLNPKVIYSYHNNYDYYYYNKPFGSNIAKETITTKTMGELFDDLKCFSNNHSIKPGFSKSLILCWPTKAPRWHEKVWKLVI